MKTKTTRFAGWLTRFLSEKCIEGHETLEVSGPSGTNWIPVECLVDLMINAPAHEQDGIKSMLVRIDFKNGNVRDYLRHLARAVAK